MGTGDFLTLTILRQVMTTPPADFRRSGVERTNPSVYPLGRWVQMAEPEIAAMQCVAASAYSKGTSGSTTQIRYCVRLLQQARTIP